MLSLIQLSCNSSHCKIRVQTTSVVPLSVSEREPTARIYVRADGWDRETIRSNPFTPNSKEKTKKLFLLRWLLRQTALLASAQNLGADSTAQREEHTHKHTHRPRILLLLDVCCQPTKVARVICDILHHSNVPPQKEEGYATPLYLHHLHNRVVSVDVVYPWLGQGSPPCSTFTTAVVSSYTRR